MMSLLRCVLFLLCFCCAALPAQESIKLSPELPTHMPWDLAKLSQAPNVEFLDDQSPVQSLLYTGENFHNKPTQVFAYYATPDTLAQRASRGKKWPAVVLVHGGGGTAFSQWVTLWAERGYCAIAMDLSGSRPQPNQANKKQNVERLAQGGPDQGHPAKFETIHTHDVTDDWPYHAVANVILAHSWLLARPEVDAERTALTGISWGGYTTCLVASLDSRFKAAVPVYGCGYLHHNSTWLNEFKKLGAEPTARWVQLYDPSSYLPACRVPMFFVNGTNDFAYPLDSYMKCYNAVKHAPKNIRIEVNMPHGHEAGWKPVEIAHFIDSRLLGKPALPELSSLQTNNGQVRCTVAKAEKLSSASFVYTTESGAINKLAWQTAPAAIQRNDELTLAVELPSSARLYFFTATTESGAIVSSPVTIQP